MHVLILHLDLCILFQFYEVGISWRNLKRGLEIMVNKVKENARFQPSPEQLEFAEIYLDYAKKLTLEDIAEKIGIAYSTIWRWFQKKDFVSWINAKKNDLLDKSLMNRYTVAIRKAEAGDFQFSKLLFEMQGEYTQKTETKVTQVNESLENLSDEEIINKIENNIRRYKSNQKRARTAIH